MLCRRLGRLLGQVAKKPQAEIVHQFRTTTRRIEAMLEAVAPEPDRTQRKLMKRLAKLRRRAGRVRDMDVQMSLLRSLKIGRDGHRKERLMQELVDRRGRREKKLLAALDGDAARDLRKRLKKTFDRLNLLRVPVSEADPEPSRPVFSPVQVALRMFVRVARAQGPLREDNLHAYRLETKHVRYVAEMAGEDRTAQKIVAELKRMQDAIGEWHDWLELSERAQKLLAPAPESPLVAALQNVTRAKYREAINVCTEGRKTLLDLAKELLPARKPAAGVEEPVNAATA